MKIVHLIPINGLRRPFRGRRGRINMQISRRGRPHRPRSRRPASMNIFESRFGRRQRVKVAADAHAVVDGRGRDRRVRVRVGRRRLDVDFGRRRRRHRLIIGPHGRRVRVAAIHIRLLTVINTRRGRERARWALLRGVAVGIGPMGLKKVLLLLFDILCLLMSSKAAGRIWTSRVSQALFYAFQQMKSVSSPSSRPQ